MDLNIGASFGLVLRYYWHRGKMVLVESRSLRIAYLKGSH
jgi:hypothetical protein